MSNVSFTSVNIEPCLFCTKRPVFHRSAGRNEHYLKHSCLLVEFRGRVGTDASAQAMASEWNDPVVKARNRIVSEAKEVA